MMVRIETWVLSAAALVTCLTLATSSSSKLPNIVLIMADDLGIGDVGCFGNDTIRTPNLDRIAAEGAMLTHHLAAASVCTPSRAAFLTGRYPIRMGMVPLNFMKVNIFVSSTAGLPPEEITFAELAKEKGYSTAFIGKWHLGVNCATSGDNCHHPLKQGFDYFYGLPLTNLRDFANNGHLVVLGSTPYVEHIALAYTFGGLVLLFFVWKLELLSSRAALGLSLVFIVPCALLYGIIFHLHLWSSVVLRNYDTVEMPVSLPGFTHRLTREGVQFLERSRRQQEDKPILLVMSWLQVHTALHAVSPFAGRSKHGRYGDEVEEMDWSVGEILNALETLGLKNSTFVYATSDNGGHIEEVGLRGNREGGWNGIYRGGKGQGGMEGGIRVPTMAMWPGKIPARSIVRAPTTNMDILPTVAALMEVAPPDDRIIDGHNILSLLTGQVKDSPYKVMFHYCEDVIHATRYIEGNNIYKVHFTTANWWPGTEGCGFMCSCKGWMVTHHDPPLMYNIAKDPAERFPLDVTEDKHRNILQKISLATEEHQQTIEEVDSQYSLTKLLPRPWLQPCCNFPYCSCRDEVYSDVPQS